MTGGLTALKHFPNRYTDANGWLYRKSAIGYLSRMIPQHYLPEGDAYYVVIVGGRKFQLRVSELRREGADARGQPQRPKA